MDAMKLGKIGITLGGVYDATQTYDKLVCVTHDGRSWVSRTAVPAGAVPSETTHRFWQLVSERGEQGPQGIQGPIGVSGPRGLQGNSGYTGAADELEVVNNLETSNARAALSAKMGMELGIEVTRLSQEWQEIKDANFNVEVQPRIEVVEPSETTRAIEPDKFYKWGEVTSLALTLIAPKESYAGSYIFQFSSPADTPTILALPVEVKFTTTPEIKAGKIYQVSIVNNLAILTEW